MVSRRSFLTGLLMGVTASGIILPTAAEALVLGDRYARLVSAIRDVLAGDDIYQSIPMTDPIVSRHRVLRDRIWVTHPYMPVYKKHCAEMSRVLFDDFGDMTPYQVDPAACIDRLTQTFTSTIDVLSDIGLSQYEDMIVTIAVMRSMLRGKVPALGFLRDSSDGPVYPHIGKFIDRYDAILPAMMFQ